MPFLSVKTIPPALLIFALLAAGCTSPAPRTPAPAPGTVHHVVLCWLKEPGNPDHRRQLIRTSRSFAGIPGVVRVSAGEMIPSPRKIVDSSFDVGVILSFATLEDLGRYLEHPDHQKAVQEVLLPLVEKIMVYDFVE